MRAHRPRWARLLAVVLTALAVGLGCSKETVPDTATTVRFSKVPLDVQLPPGFSQAQNTAEWLVYRSRQEGTFVAMSGERSCPLVEKRLYSALIELGLDQVVWKSAPQPTTLQGLRATVAEGTAMAAEHPTNLKYSMVFAPANMGCLITLAAYRQTDEAQSGAVADRIVRSVKARD